MDDELKELERELAQLRPLAPPERLGNLLEVALARPQRHRATWLLWLTLPAAAALILAFHHAYRAELRTDPLFEPVAAENLLLDTRMEGYVTLEDGTPARRIRESYLDTITWEDPRRKASLKWTLPREEIRVVPVVFQ